MIFNDFDRFVLISNDLIITNLQNTCSPRPKKRPLRENAPTAKGFLTISKDCNNSKRFLWILNNFNITIVQKSFVSIKKGPCGKMDTHGKRICVHDYIGF